MKNFITVSDLQDPFLTVVLIYSRLFPTKHQIKKI
jgi:hypothetical protein